jgi:hypothetical protein
MLLYHHPYRFLFLLVRFYDMEVIDKVKDVMVALASQAADQMDAWRTTSESGGQGTLEDQLVGFLGVVKAAHERARLPSSQLVVETTISVVRDFQSNIQPYIFICFIVSFHRTAS